MLNRSYHYSREIRKLDVLELFENCSEFFISHLEQDKQKLDEAVDAWENFFELSFLMPNAFDKFKLALMNDQGLAKTKNITLFKNFLDRHPIFTDHVYGMLQNLKTAAIKWTAKHSQHDNAFKQKCIEFTSQPMKSRPISDELHYRTENKDIYTSVTLEQDSEMDYRSSATKVKSLISQIKNTEEQIKRLDKKLAAIKKSDKRTTLSALKAEYVEQKKQLEERKNSDQLKMQSLQNEMKIFEDRQKRQKASPLLLTHDYYEIETIKKSNSAEPTSIPEHIERIQAEVINNIHRIFNKKPEYHVEIIKAINSKPLESISSKTLNDLKTYSEKELNPIKHKLIKEIQELLDNWVINLETLREYKEDKKVIKLIQKASLSTDEKSTVWTGIEKEFTALSTYEYGCFKYQDKLRDIAAKQVEMCLASRKSLVVAQAPNVEALIASVKNTLDLQVEAQHLDIIKDAENIKQEEAVIPVANKIIANSPIGFFQMSYEAACKKLVTTYFKSETEQTKMLSKFSNEEGELYKLLSPLIRWTLARRNKDMHVDTVNAFITGVLRSCRFNDIDVTGMQSHLKNFETSLKDQASIHQIKLTECKEEVRSFIEKHTAGNKHKVKI